jgi:hypothetical protein
LGNGKYIRNFLKSANILYGYEIIFVGNKLNCLNINKMRERKEGTYKNYNTDNIYYYRFKNIKRRFWLCLKSKGSELLRAEVIAAV